MTAAGLAVGYLVLAFAIAPGLRAFGAYTAGDFIAARFGGLLARLIWAAMTFSVSFLLFVAHLKIAAPLIATLLGITPEHALYAAAGLTAMAALPGGMRSLSWTQAIQYFVIALACVVPAAFFASGEPVSESAIAAQFNTLLIRSLPDWQSAGAAGWVLPFLLAALGAASLPHLNARALSAPSGREAVTSMMWAVLFSFVLVLAGFVLFELLAGAVAPDASQGAVGGLVQLAALFSALPSVLAGLLLAGTLAALFSLGQAALFSAAAAISHDVWDEIIDRKGPEGRRIMLARLILIGVSAGAVALVPLWQAEADESRGLGAGACRGGELLPARPRALVAPLQRDRRDRRHDRGVRLHQPRLPAWAGRHSRRHGDERLGGCRRVDGGGGRASDVARGDGRPLAGDAGAGERHAERRRTTTAGCRSANDRPRKRCSEVLAPRLALHFPHKADDATHHPLGQDLDAAHRLLLRDGAVRPGARLKRRDPLLKRRDPIPLRSCTTLGGSLGGRHADRRAVLLKAERDLASRRIEAEHPGFGRRQGETVRRADLAGRRGRCRYKKQ